MLKRGVIPTFLFYHDTNHRILRRSDRKLSFSVVQEDDVACGVDSMSVVDNRPLVDVGIR